VRVAILGMGNMGRAFAARALERGHHVTVWNRSPGRAGELVGRGAIEAESPKAAVIEADAVLGVLADDAAVLAVCVGDDGVLGWLAPAAVFANISTVSPDTARLLAEVGPGARVLDSPVMGSPALVTGGLGRFLIGGPVETITALDPLWSDLGAGYIHCGPVGAGATMKVISNLLLITGVAALAEESPSPASTASPTSCCGQSSARAWWSVRRARSGWRASSMTPTRAGSRRSSPAKTCASRSLWPRRPTLGCALAPPPRRC